MGKKDFIDRKSAKHFHVVHRSQRDPLINDAEAPDRVLKEYIPGNLQKHKTQQEINAIKQKPVQLNQDEIDSRVTLATQQGIYFDDVGEYDYAQHLRIMGSATESIFLEAPKREDKKKNAGGLQFKDDADKNDETNKKVLELPADVLPSEIERNVGAMSQLTGLEGGLQPDMDPRLREILEALEDEEYVEEEEANDDFFAELNADGPQYEPEEDEEDDFEEEIEDDGNYNWEAAFRNFKRGKQRGDSSDEEDDDDLLERQTKGTSFSVSSSVMHRNAQLTLLDDRFDKIEEEYMRDDESDEDDDAPGLEDRADFENILDDFLDKYEIVGRKMAFKLDGETGGEKLDTIRQSLGEIRLDDNEQEKPKLRKQDIENMDLWERPKKHRETWDCQSVLSTYSNLDNHPAVISDRGISKKIVVDPKTGMPALVEKARKPRVDRRKRAEEEADKSSDDEEQDSEDDENEEEPVNLGIPRSKGESKEEKKARKAAVKEAKKNRREVKKTTKKAFRDEENRQRMTMQQQRKAKGVTHIA